MAPASTSSCRGSKACSSSSETAKGDPHHEYCSSHRHRHRRRRRPRAPCRSSRWRVAATSAAPARCPVRPCNATSRRGAPPRRPSSRRPPRRPRSKPPGRPTARRAPRWPRSTASRSSSRGPRRTPRRSVSHARQFFNRATVALMSVGLVTFAAVGLRRLPVADRHRRLRRPRSTSASSATSRTASSRATGSSTPPRRGRGSPSTRPRRCRSPRRCMPRTLLVTMRQGIVILSQKCPHLGCRVPECNTSQWFECQCHGSQYNRAGEKKAGPGPARHGPLPGDDRGERRGRRSTPASSSPARRSVRTRPVRKPKVRTAPAVGKH